MQGPGPLFCLTGLLTLGCARPGSIASVPPPPLAAIAAPQGEGSALDVRASSVGRTPLDLSAFRPVLAEAEHAAARAAFEAGDPEGAAHLLWQLEQEPKTIAEAERAFSAGLLFLEAGATRQAALVFERSAALRWELRADAALRRAELALPEDAALGWAFLQEAEPLRGEIRYQRVRARLAEQLGRADEALDAWRELFRGRAELEDLTGYATHVLAQNEEKSTPELVSEKIALARSLRVRLIALDAGDKKNELTELVGRLGEPPDDGEQALLELGMLVDSGRLEEAVGLGQRLRERPEFRSPGRARCESDYLTAKALSLRREWGKAADFLESTVSLCDGDAALHAKILFCAGKYAAADGRDARAVRYYAELEAKYPENSLADDARLRAARSYKDMGAVARFTDLLLRMPEDYPTGDMTMEGVLELALFRAERSDWGAAELVLERGARLVRGRDHERGTEFSGTERYFLARAWGAQGQTERALDEYESIVREVPLSYYMLHAYSRLREAAPERAARGLEAALLAAEEQPFSFPSRPEYARPEFRRGLGLLRVGDREGGRRALSAIGLAPGVEEGLLWGLALLYDRAGDAQAGHSLARGRLTDWLGHYPRGAWQKPWEIGFPRPYHSYVSRESQATGVPEWLIYGVMREESTFDPKAESPANAYGLMQVIVPTARSIGQKSGLPWSRAALLEPKTNIAIGSRVLKELLRRFETNPWLAIPGYNAGPGRPARWLRERPQMDFDLWVELIPIRETRRYTKRVLASRAAYAFLYDPGSMEDALVLPRRLTAP